MKYIIDKEVINWILDIMWTDEGRSYISDYLGNLKSKTPVEEIAEGEVTRPANRVIEFNNEFFTDATETLFYRMVKPYQDKNIKIYIEVIK